LAKIHRSMATQTHQLPWSNIQISSDRFVLNLARLPNSSQKIIPIRFDWYSNTFRWTFTNTPI
jgi:hypothetical protein